MSINLDHHSKIIIIPFMIKVQIKIM